MSWRVSRVVLVKGNLCGNYCWVTTAKELYVKFCLEKVEAWQLRLVLTLILLLANERTSRISRLTHSMWTLLINFKTATRTSTQTLFKSILSMIKSSSANPKFYSSTFCPQKPSNSSRAEWLMFSSSKCQNGHSDSIPSRAGLGDINVFSFLCPN